MVLTYYLLEENLCGKKRMEQERWTQCERNLDLEVPSVTVKLVQFTTLVSSGSHGSPVPSLRWASFHRVPINWFIPGTPNGGEEVTENWMIPIKGKDF